MASPDASPAPRASAKDYQRMYFDVRHKPLTVNSVEVKGDERTRPGLFAKVLAPIYEAGTLDELRVKCLEANAVLHSYDIFDRVDVLCDAGPEDAPSNTATVTVDVSEKKKFNLKGGAYVSQSGEGSVEMSAGLNNAFGFAEKVDVEAIKGHERSSTYTLAWNQPRVNNLDVDVVTRAFQQVSTSTRLSSFDETTRGVAVAAVGGGPARVEYELAWREITDPTKLASKQIRHQLGHTLKSSVAYTYHVDERDRPSRPSAGYLARVRAELAGLGFVDPQATRFFKTECEAQAVKTLAPGVVLSASGKLGALLPLDLRSRDASDPMRGVTCVSDRFFLGGVGSLRGFDAHGAGPSDERRPPKEAPEGSDADGAGAREVISRDALGGDLLAVGFVAVQLEPAFKKLRDIGCYAHAFVNAGALAPYPKPTGKPTEAKKTFSFGGYAEAVRASVGVGLVFPLPVGNIEVNYVKTTRAQEGDRVKDGIQVGLATALAF